MPESPRPPAVEGHKSGPVEGHKPNPVDGQKPDSVGGPKPELSAGVLQEAAECSGAGIDLRGQNGGKTISLVAAPACVRCRRETPAIYVHCCSEVRRSLGLGQSDLCVHGQVLRVAGGGEFLVIAPAQRVSRFVRLLEGLGELEEAAASRAIERTLIERTLRSLVMTLEERQPATRGHSRRVQIACDELGELLGLDPEARAELSWAALLHDLGEIGSPDHILEKPSILTREEMEVVRQHPAKGEKLLEPLVWLKGARLGVRHHHERFDGQGYPDQLAGETIPLVSRIIAVADTFDAITTRRNGTAAKVTAAKAAAALEQASGSQLDPTIVHIFIAQLDAIQEALLAAEAGAEETAIAEDAGAGDEGDRLAA